MPPSKDPPILPAYHKPEAPGIWMNFDNTVSIYHVVGAEDTFLKATRDVYGAVREAQERFPGWPRLFYLDIVGHTHPRHGFDDDFIEFQQEFWFSVIAPFLTGFDLPLTGGLINPDPQRDDLPETLGIKDPGTSL